MGLLVAGCSKPAPQTGETITDEVGRTLQVTIPAKRIVSMAPSITEILFAIGAGKQVVGVTDFCNFPAGADSLPTIGGLTTPSAEQLLLLTPDLVVATADGNPRQLADRLGNAGVPFYTTHPVSTFWSMQGEHKQVRGSTGASSICLRGLSANVARVAAPISAR